MRGCALRKVVRKERESFIHRFPVPPLPPLGERERERERERESIFEDGNRAAVLKATHEGNSITEEKQI